MVDYDFIRMPEAVSAKVVADPVYSALSTLYMLENSDMHNTLDEWVSQTAKSMSAEHRRDNRFFEILPFTYEMDGEWESFPAFIDEIEREDASVLRDRALHSIVNIPKAKLEMCHIEDVPTAEEILNKREAFFNLNQSLTALSGKVFDEDIFAEAHQLLNDPPRMKAKMVAHLRYMWNTYLADEWARKLPAIQATVDAFSEADLSGLTIYEVIQRVTGRDLRNHWDDVFTRATSIVFIPGMHIRPYIMLFGLGDPIRMVFGVQTPEETKKLATPSLSVSEMLVRMNALADDTRLRILQLLVEETELCAQDIMTRLELSQSATSRHLRMLTAAGYLTERRREVAKCYMLNEERIEDTLDALRHFLLGRG